MKLQTKDLTGDALDWAVAKCEGWEGEFIDMPNYCTDWARGGVIIERERIALLPAPVDLKYWASNSTVNHAIGSLGDTPLIAAMRCYVASKLGNEVEVPDEITN